MIGEVIWEGKEGAVYKRSQNKYDEDLPCTGDFGRKGAVFCSYQLLGSNPFDLVVCIHHYRKEDRERRSLYSFNVVDVFRSVSYYIAPCGAVCMLEKMRRYWGSVPHKTIDIHSWYPVIANLIDKISGSFEATDIFRKKYPNLLYLNRLHSIQDKNRRGQARAWLNQQEKKYLTVQEGFAKLGYPSLEDECAVNGGFVCDDEPNEKQNGCFEILEDLIETLYEGFFVFMEAKPGRKIIINDRSSYHGMAKIYPNGKKVINNWGIYVRNTVGEIYLKKQY